MVHPDFTKKFKLYTDASDTGLGAVLIQDNEKDQEKVVGYVSRTLNETERKWMTTEKECLAVVWGIEYFQTYLDERKIFEVYTDHAAL